MTKTFTQSPDHQAQNTAAKAGRKEPPVHTRWKPGQSGNPKGRPKSLTLSEAYRRELAKVDPADPAKRTFAEVLAEQMIIKAKRGDVAALKEIADRVEGKSKQSVTLTVERRAKYERAIENMMEEATAEGEELSREEAIAALALFEPEVSYLIN